MIGFAFGGGQPGGPPLSASALKRGGVGLLAGDFLDGGEEVRRGCRWGFVGVGVISLVLLLIVIWIILIRGRTLVGLLRWFVKVAGGWD